MNLSTMFFRVNAEKPGEWVVSRINKGFSLKTCLQWSINSESWFSIFQTSPPGPRPKVGGSMMMPS